MKPTILNTTEAQEYYFHEGCHILELSNSPADEAVSIARARVEPGQTTRWHRLRDTTERYVILQGQGLVEIADLEPRTISSGDVVIIPPLHNQRITNTGAEDLVFLAICSPRFRSECYEDTQNEIAHQQRENEDSKILNRMADELNTESEDTLSWQTSL